MATGHDYTKLIDRLTASSTRAKVTKAWLNAAVANGVDTKKGLRIVARKTQETVGPASQGKYLLSKNDVTSKNTTIKWGAFDRMAAGKAVRGVGTAANNYGQGTKPKPGGRGNSPGPTPGPPPDKTGPGGKGTAPSAPRGKGKGTGKPASNAAPSNPPGKPTTVYGEADVGRTGYTSAQGKSYAARHSSAASGSAGSTGSSKPDTAGGNSSGGEPGPGKKGKAPKAPKGFKGNFKAGKRAKQGIPTGYHVNKDGKVVPNKGKRDKGK